MKGLNLDDLRCAYCGALIGYMEAPGTADTVTCTRGECIERAAE